MIMERIMHLFSSVENFVDALEKQGFHKVFSDIKTDLETQQKGNNNSVVDKLCELQNDHLWFRQAIEYTLSVLRDRNCNPPYTVLNNCYDLGLGDMGEVCFDEAKNAVKRIYELEREVAKLKMINKELEKKAQ